VNHCGFSSSGSTYRPPYQHVTSDAIAFESSNLRIFLDSSHHPSGLWIGLTSIPLSHHYPTVTLLPSHPSSAQSMAFRSAAAGPGARHRRKRHPEAPPDRVDDGDHGFAASEGDDDHRRRSKRAKTTTGGGPTPGLASTGSKTDSNGDVYWELSKLRRVTVSSFKNRTLVHIREYYEKDGQELPGKKVSFCFPSIPPRSR
jgi:hypothetical protein